MTVATPDLAEVQRTAEMIRPHVVETPSVRWVGVELRKTLDKGTQIFARLELFQHSGTFKARGTLSNILRLDESAQASSFAVPILTGLPTRPCRRPRSLQRHW